ncbi:hypothetical protein [Uruburuella testudinis]|nr:hypothetical protein [Uruburuella testudinis]
MPNSAGSAFADRLRPSENSESAVSDGLALMVLPPVTVGNADVA